MRRVPPPPLEHPMEHPPRQRRRTPAQQRCSSALHHAWKLYEGDWWVVGRPLVASVGYAPAIAVDLLLNTVLWLLMHSCPVPVVRGPRWVGPHHAASSDRA
jgi:hypothetical protein